MRQVLIVLAALFALSMAGCAKRSPSEGWYREEVASSSGYADEAPMEMAKAAYAPPGAYDSDDASPPPEPSPEATSSPAPEPAARMVHYEGWVRLRVVRPEESADALAARAREAGGYVERIGGTTITLRVPVAGFQAFFDGVLDMGDVIGKSISAEDVTEAFTATDLRLQTARATRDRLVALLAKSVDEEEKLALVREIQRVSEEVDRLEVQVRTLATLAAFSRITVELVPREALAWQGNVQEAAEFAWIRELSPFRRDVAARGKRLVLGVPDGMVRLDPRRSFVVESPDGARMWASKLSNEPIGDAAFWLAAVEERLSPEFATAEKGQMGGFLTLRFVDRSDEPYVYVVGLRAEGRRLHLVEVYYPSAAQEDRHGAAVRAAIAGGAS